LPVALRFWQHTRGIPSNRQGNSEKQHSGSERSATSGQR
jgi:hypothetical protein